MSANLRNRIIIFAVIMLLGLAFLWPTISVTYRKLSGGKVTAEEMVKGGLLSRPIALGLDLSGGVHLVYKVKAHEAVTSRLQAMANTMREELRKQKVPVTKAAANAKNEIELTLLSETQLEKAKGIIEQSQKGLLFKGKISEEGRTRLLYGISENEAATIEHNAIQQSVETLRARVDQFGVAEPLIQRVGEDRIMLQMPGIEDIEAVKNVVGKVAKLEFRLLPGPGKTTGSVTLKDRQGAPIEVEDVVQMTGDAVETARADFESSGQLEVLLSLTTQGGKDFGRITGANVGRQLAIILDGIVYSSPRINERIGGGSCSITGGFDFHEAKQLAVVLKAGALPAPLEVLEERTVGPTLGRESINKGIRGSLVGCVLITLFMILYYKKSGVVTVGSLFVNIFLLLAVLSAFGATLTLPGLAGLALTFGMAVDSNVVIMERIREEIRNGAGRDPAVAAGFSNGLSAVLDSNFTTLLSGIILYWFGTGPIRGFAVTLSIGVLTTILCATFVSRLAFDCFPMKSGKGLSIE